MKNSFQNEKFMESNTCHEQINLFDSLSQTMFDSNVRNTFQLLELKKFIFFSSLQCINKQLHSVLYSTNKINLNFDIRIEKWWLGFIGKALLNSWTLSLIFLAFCVYDD